MATYLVVEDGEVPVIHEADAKNIQQAIEQLAPSIGNKVTVYRVAAGPKTVTVLEETIRRIEIE
jgi:hypothetical protein